MSKGDKYLPVMFYCTGAGNEPVREWLKSLDAKDRKAIGEDIKTVQYGWPMGMPLVRKMSAGLWEIRSHLAGRIVRVLFTEYKAMLVLLHGFIKKTQETPLSELELARRRLKEVQEQ